jgi:hypothetical protein
MIDPELLSASVLQRVPSVAFCCAISTSDCLSTADDDQNMAQKPSCMYVSWW